MRGEREQHRVATMPPPRPMLDRVQVRGYRGPGRGKGHHMTAPDEGAASESVADEEVLAPATPGADALPLPDDEVEKPSDG